MAAQSKKPSKKDKSSSSAKGKSSPAKRRPSSSRADLRDVSAVAEASGDQLRDGFEQLRAHVGEKFEQLRVQVRDEFQQLDVEIEELRAQERR
jgi:hypothetical protein